jgi:hypothetical protein
LKSYIVSTVQAVLSLSLASMAASNFDLSWLDGLPAPHDPKLHDSANTIMSFVNLRVLIAEVLEGQGRHKEAIRCVDLYSFALLTRSCSLMHPLPLLAQIAALLLPTCNTVSTSARRQRCVQGG